MIKTVDVIIPVYNGGKYLKPALNSVFEQKLHGRKLTVRVIDDGSTDDSVLIEKNLQVDFTAKGMLFDLITQDNTGAATARNNAIKNGTGEVIIALDCDNILGPDYISKTIRCMEDNDADVVYTPMRWFGKINKRVEFPEFSELYMRTSNLAHAGSPFRRTWWEAVGGYPAELDHLSLEDWALYLRMVQAGAKFAYCPDTEIFYRWEGTGISADLLKDAQKQALLLSKMQQMFGDYLITGGRI